MLQADLFHLPPIFTRAALWTFGTHPAQSPLTPPSDRIFRNAWCTPRNLKSRCNLWVDSPVKSLLVPVLCCSGSSHKIRNLYLQGSGPPDPFLNLSLAFMPCHNILPEIPVALESSDLVPNSTQPLDPTQGYNNKCM